MVTQILLTLPSVEIARYAGRSLNHVLICYKIKLTFLLALKHFEYGILIFEKFVTNLLQCNFFIM